MGPKCQIVLNDDNILTVHSLSRCVRNKGPKMTHFDIFDPLIVKISTLPPLCFRIYFFFYKFINYKKLKIPTKNCIPLLGLAPRDPRVWSLESPSILCPCLQIAITRPGLCLPFDFINVFKYLRCKKVNPFDLHKGIGKFIRC